MLAKIGSLTYPLFIKNGAIKTVGDKIKADYPASRVMVVSDDKVFSLYGEAFMQTLAKSNIEAMKIVLPQGEGTKSFTAMQAIIDKLANNGYTRDDMLIALGGGVIGDVTGFCASCYLRGIKYIQIPTTLLAQVDSSIGGKTAINIPQGKNLVGAFYQPTMVFIDPDVLTTLDDDDYACGMAEIIKTALIQDKDLFQILGKYTGREEMHTAIVDVIKRCCEIKLDVVCQDERDKGLRMILNFGHTIGHALEKLKNVSIKHGEAVAIGMAAITKEAEKAGLTNKGTYDKIVQMLIQHNLPHSLDGYDLGKALKLAKLDKKNLNNKLNLVLLKDIGECYIHSVNYNEFVDLMGGV